MQKNGKLYHYPLVSDTKKGGLSLLFIYVKYNASSAYMPYSANALCLILQGLYCLILQVL